MYSYGSPHMAKQKQDDQLEHIYSSYVKIQDVALKTCWRRWTIGISGETGLRISVLLARHDDDDESTPSWPLLPASFGPWEIVPFSIQYEPLSLTSRSKIIWYAVKMNHYNGISTLSLCSPFFIPSSLDYSIIYSYV